MAKYPRIREQHIAVFGESGSGKTVLASSFYGPSQERSSSNDLWDLVADDTGLGTRLYKNYLGMRDHATAPGPTRFAGTTYYFSVKLKGGGKAKAKKRPFDILRLAWHDYPGEWFEESPSSEGEANRRVDTGVTPVVRSGACESSMRPRRWASEDDHDEANQAHSGAGHPQAARGRQDAG